MNKIFNQLLIAEDQREFLMSRVNRSDLLLLQGYAELEEDHELAYLIWEVRTS